MTKSTVIMIAILIALFLIASFFIGYQQKIADNNAQGIMLYYCKECDVVPEPVYFFTRITDYNCPFCGAKLVRANIWEEVTTIRGLSTTMQ